MSEQHNGADCTAQFFPLFSLPLELQDKVVERVDNRTLKIVRLSSHALNRWATPELFRKLELNTTFWSIAKLMRVAEHQTLRYHVKELVCNDFFTRSTAAIHLRPARDENAMDIDRHMSVLTAMDIVDFIDTSISTEKKPSPSPQGLTSLVFTQKLYSRSCQPLFPRLNEVYWSWSGHVTRIEPDPAPVSIQPWPRTQAEYMTTIMRQIVRTQWLRGEPDPSGKFHLPLPSSTFCSSGPGLSHKDLTAKGYEMVDSTHYCSVERADKDSSSRRELEKLLNGIGQWWDSLRSIAWSHDPVKKVSTHVFLFQNGINIPFKVSKVCIIDVRICPDQITVITHHMADFKDENDNYYRWPK